MINYPLVSFIIPLFNKEEFIANCIGSVLKQTYPNYEIIIVDDGSTDSSKDIVNEFIKGTDKIKYCYQENKGVSIARNKGIELCNGEFVLFLDADDSIAPDFVQNLISNHQEGDDIVICGLTKVFEHKNIKKVNVPNNGSFSKEQIFKDFLFHQQKDGIYGFVCSKLIKSEIVKNNNIQFNENIKLAEDLDFFIQYYSFCKRFKLIDGNGYYYYQDSNSDSKKNVDYIQLIGVYLKLQQILLKSDCLNTDNRSALQYLFSEFKLAYFNELKTINKKVIKRGIKELIDFQIVNTKKNKIIKWLVESELVFFLITYLKFRLLYINVKTRI